MVVYDDQTFNYERARAAHPSHDYDTPRLFTFRGSRNCRGKAPYGLAPPQARTPRAMQRPSTSAGPGISINARSISMGPCGDVYVVRSARSELSARSEYENPEFPDYRTRPMPAQHHRTTHGVLKKTRFRGRSSSAARVRQTSEPPPMMSSQTLSQSVNYDPRHATHHNMAIWNQPHLWTPRAAGKGSPQRSGYNIGFNRTNLNATWANPGRPDSNIGFVRLRGSGAGFASEQPFWHPGASYGMAIGEFANPTTSLGHHKNYTTSAGYAGKQGHFTGDISLCQRTANTLGMTR